MIMTLRKIRLLAVILTAGFTLAAVQNIKEYSGRDVSGLVDEIARRRSLYPEMKHWQAKVKSVIYEMNKDWQPEKKTVVHKILTVKDKSRRESIKSAVETKDGKNKDVTQEYINKAYKEMEKNARKKREGKKNKDKKRGRRHMDLAEEDVFPFDAEKRAGYDFTLLGESSLEGKPVYVIETRAKKRSEDFFEGKYYADKETFDILRAELQLAKNPGPLKLMEMELDFQILPQGHHALKATAFRIHVGLIIKNIRMEAVEEYSDYRILN